MARTLYVADMDGTLLDREGVLSEYTIRTIRRMTDADMLFTIATARSLQSANDLIWLLGIRLPSILNNGAMVYDSVSRRYIHASAIPLDAIPSILVSLEQHNVCGFLHTLRNDHLSVYFREFRQAWDRVYHAHRIEQLQGRIWQVENLYEVARYNHPVYAVACGCYEVLCEVQRELAQVRGISAEIYCDVYNNFYFMDIFPSSFNKVHGVLTIQQITGAEELVTFGDNFPDMQMLLVADRAYVPKNGIAAARNIADEILDYAHRDGVAHFLAQEMGWE